MISQLKELPLEEQMKKFAIIVYENRSSYSYGECDYHHEGEKEIAVEKCADARGWIVKDGIIVGMAFANYRNDIEYKFLDAPCNTYFCSDDDGVGSTDVIVTCRLVWKQQNK